MDKKDNIANIICYGFLSIFMFACTFPWFFPLVWLLADFEDKECCWHFAKLFSPKFWYNLTKDTIHDNWN